MKLTGFDIFHYQLPLKRALTSGDPDRLVREGMLIRLRDGSGAYGWGECAPLPPVTHETVDIALGQLSRMRLQVMGAELPDGLEFLDGGFGSWLSDLNLAPSVRFGFETACLHMIARSRGINLARLLSPSPSDIVPVNALLELSQPDVIETATAKREAGYRTFKLKAGRQTIDEDIKAVHKIRGAVGDDAILRVDANQLWTAQALLSVWSEVEGCNIEYFEEPVTDMVGLIEYLDRKGVSIPLALDESLAQSEADQLIISPYVEGLVIKPTVLGLERSVGLMKMARKAGKKAVVSSTFESSIGIFAMVHTAAAFADSSTAMGLDTGGWLADDLLSEPALSRNGRFDVEALPNVPERIECDLLTEMLFRE